MGKKAMRQVSRPRIFSANLPNSNLPIPLHYHHHTIPNHGITITISRYFTHTQPNQTTFLSSNWNLVSFLQLLSTYNMRMRKSIPPVLWRRCSLVLSSATLPANPWMFTFHPPLASSSTIPSLSLISSFIFSPYINRVGCYSSKCATKCDLMCQHCVSSVFGVWDFFPSFQTLSCVSSVIYFLCLLFLSLPCQFLSPSPVCRLFTQPTIQFKVVFASSLFLEKAS